MNTKISLLCFSILLLSFNFLACSSPVDLNGHYEFDEMKDVEINAISGNLPEDFFETAKIRNHDYYYLYAGLRQLRIDLSTLGENYVFEFHGDNVTLLEDITFPKNKKNAYSFQATEEPEEGVKAYTISTYEGGLKINLQFNLELTDNTGKVTGQGSIDLTAYYGKVIGDD